MFCPLNRDQLQSCDAPIIAPQRKDGEKGMRRTEGGRHARRSVKLGGTDAPLTTESQERENDRRRMNNAERRKKWMTDTHKLHLKDTAQGF